MHLVADNRSIVLNFITVIVEIRMYCYFTFQGMITDPLEWDHVAFYPPVHREALMKLSNPPLHLAPIPLPPHLHRQYAYIKRVEKWNHKRKLF